MKAQHDSPDLRRIFPAPPAAHVKDRENDDAWGYCDSGFELTRDGHVRFRGTRYPIGGAVMPHFLPWVERMLCVRLTPGRGRAARAPSASPEHERNAGETNGRVASARVANEPLERALASVIPPDRISTDVRARRRRGHGHAQSDMWSVKHESFARIPDLVVWPTDAREVEIVLDLVRVHGARLLPFGGGTNVTEALHCPASERRTIVALDLRRMNHVLWIDPENRTAEIQAGATGRQIAEQLAAHGFTLGHEPDSAEHSTLGGWIATNASGMKKNRYGNIEDLVLSVSAVTPRGSLQRAASPRESVGADPARWMIGSEGRLGVVTSAVTKVFPLPECRRFGSAVFRDFAAGFAFLRAVRREGCAPTSIRLADEMQFQFGHALRERRSGFDAARAALAKAWLTKVRRFEPARTVACTMLFEGGASEVTAQERVLRDLVRRSGGVWAGAANGARGYELTFVIAYLRDFLLDLGVVGESLETSVPWSEALALCANVKRRIRIEHASRGLPGRPYVGCRVTQLYETGVCIYFYCAFAVGSGADASSVVADASSVVADASGVVADASGVGADASSVGADASRAFAEIERAARDEILRSGGSLSHHHGVGRMRREFLPRVFSPTALSLRRALRASFDPNGVLGGGVE